MCKKLWIAALAVVVGLVTLGMTSTRVGGLIRHKWKSVVVRANEQVSPETDVELVREKLDGLVKEDRRFVDQIVRYDLQVEDMQKKVEARRTAFVKLDTEVREMFVSLKGEGQQVSFQGSNFSRADMQRQVRIDAEKLQRAEAALKADEARLKELTETRDLYKTRLEELRAERDSMRTELQRLENALLRERQAQVKSKVAADDGGLGGVRRDLETLKHRVRVMQKTREVQGSTDEGPVRRAQAAKQREANIDNFLQNRYSAPAPVGTTDATKR